MFFLPFLLASLKIFEDLGKSLRILMYLPDLDLTGRGFEPQLSGNQLEISNNFEKPTDFQPHEDRNQLEFAKSN